MSLLKTPNSNMFILEKSGLHWGILLDTMEAKTETHLAHQSLSIQPMSIQLTLVVGKLQVVKVVSHIIFHFVSEYSAQSPLTVVLTLQDRQIMVWNTAQIHHTVSSRTDSSLKHMHHTVSPHICSDTPSCGFWGDDVYNARKWILSEFKSMFQRSYKGQNWKYRKKRNLLVGLS